MDKIKRREAIFDKILKQMGPEIDKCYVKYYKDLGTYYVGKYEKVIVIDSSDKVVEKENKQLTWMRLIKSQKSKVKQKE